MTIFKYIAIGSLVFLLVVFVICLCIGMIRFILYLIHASESELFESAELRYLDEAVYDLKKAVDSLKEGL